MSAVYQKELIIAGQQGIIVWDKLCADGPLDPKTKEPLIDPETNQPFPGLNDDMADLLHDYLLKLRGPSSLPSGGIVPRFGILSLLAAKTPIFCYDHPRLKKISNTAFTDGRSIFIDADFMRKLVHQEEDSNGKFSGVLWVLMHELMHKLFNHVRRLKNLPADIANIAEDYVINGKMTKGFPTIKPVSLLNEICVGMKPEDAEKYHTMAEEVVGEMLYRQQLQKEKKKKEKEKENEQSGNSSEQGGEGEESEEKSDKPSKGKGKKGEKGKGEKSPGNSEEGDDEQESEEKSDKSSKGKGKKGEKGKGEKSPGNSEEGDDDDDQEKEYSDTHTITPEELLEALEEAGLEGAKEALGMPDSGNLEEIGRMKEKNELSIIDSIQQAESQAMNCSGQYPGKEITQAAAQLIGNIDKGKITWKLAVKRVYQGEGQKLYHTDDVAALTWYVDKATMGVDPFYMGSPIPQAPDEAVVTLVDMSGSTAGGTLRKEFLAECLAIKKSQSSLGDSARKVFIYSADTAILGDPVEVNEHNIEKLRNEGVPVFDGGGTNFTSCLNQVMTAPIMKKEKIKVVVYFTDCFDEVPKREDFAKYLDMGIKFIFVTSPGLFNAKWNAELKWAEVYAMEEGTVVDLGKDVNNVDINTRKNRLN